MAKINFVEFALRGEPATAQQTAADALTHQKFRIDWADPFTATAERGNKVANVLLGALAQYFKVGVRIGPGGTPDTTILRLERQSSGWMGGAIGAARTTKNMASLRDGIASWLQGQQLLVGVNEG